MTSGLSSRSFLERNQAVPRLRRPLELTIDGNDLLDHIAHEPGVVDDEQAVWHLALSLEVPIVKDGYISRVNANYAYRRKQSWRKSRPEHFTGL
jgi:hypothetical protein